MLTTRRRKQKGKKQLARMEKRAKKLRNANAAVGSASATKPDVEDATAR
jgi:hypothetical protein